MLAGWSAVFRYLAPVKWWTPQCLNRRPKPTYEGTVLGTERATGIEPASSAWKAEVLAAERRSHLTRLLHRTGRSVLRCGRLAVHLSPIGAARTPQPVLTPEDLRVGRSRLVVGCGTAAAYPVPGTTRWYVCGSAPPHFSRRTPPGSRTPYPLIKSQVL